MSWDPFGDGKTAIRAGWGISYDRLFDNLLTWNASQLPFGVAGDWPTGGNGYDGVLPNGAAYFGHGTPVPEVTLHLPAASYYTMVVYNTEWNQPYIQTWNVSVQREIIPGHILTVAYAGSAGVNLLGRQQSQRHVQPDARADPGDRGQRLLHRQRAHGRALRPGAELPVVPAALTSTPTSTPTTTPSRPPSAAASPRACRLSVNYTWSKAFDNNSESVYTEGGSSPFSSNPWNSSQDRGYAGL